ncbi:DUF883 family protein [Noviherbaspirillum massiliense]|uniref:DUF883 family protein n=1 Tax=Noviherbaspirillum massiliense TaxID=1465823 RepID=UPI00036676B1|nr:DUF883 family protein [Noviherbaspirillum massiliense]
MDNMGQKFETRSRLMDDLKAVIKEAEEFLRNTGSQAGEGYQTARARFESTLSNAKDGLSSLQSQAMSSSKDAMEAADQYVHTNPWQAVGIGALAGLIVGLVLGRK